jgi:hypothetical protein
MIFNLGSETPTFFVDNRRRFFDVYSVADDVVGSVTVDVAWYGCITWPEVHLVDAFKEDETKLDRASSRTFDVPVRNSVRVSSASGWHLRKRSDDVTNSDNLSSML